MTEVSKERFRQAYTAIMGDRVAAQWQDVQFDHPREVVTMIVDVAEFLFRQNVGTGGEDGDVIRSVADFLDENGCLPWRRSRDEGNDG